VVCHVHKCDTYIQPLHVHPFIHPSLCGSLSYYKWFATCRSATPIFNPSMSSHSFIHPCLLCGSLHQYKWFATFTSATPIFNPCMSIHSSILLYMVRSVIISGLPRSEVRHLYSTPACPVIHSSILVFYVVRSISISGLPRSQVRHLYSTPAYAPIHPSFCMWFAQLL